VERVLDRWPVGAHPRGQADERREPAAPGVGEPRRERADVPVPECIAESLRQRVAGGEVGVGSEDARQVGLLVGGQTIRWAQEEPAHVLLVPGTRLGRRRALRSPSRDEPADARPAAGVAERGDLGGELAAVATALRPASLQVR
jgi:hypothetical protein